jgi:hypothetical protein
VYRVQFVSRVNLRHRELRGIQGKGYAIAKELWPDAILQQPPKHLQQS